MTSVPSRNNAVVQHCYVSLATQQWMAYPQRHTTMKYTIIAYVAMGTERDDFYGYETVVYRLLLICGVSSRWQIARRGPVERVQC
jgi:hypothetical protein